MRLTHLSLFSGIGGLDLAAEWAGIQTVGQCEWAEYPAKVLEKHWPDIPRWKDIRTLTGESFYERTGRRTVDIISGGFPCQPFSVAGKQRGKEDDRYFWPEMVRVIKELRPAWVVGENVAGIVRMALSDILFELEACGYKTRTFLVPACAVGARHRRYRVAIVGYSEHNGLSSAAVTGSTQKAGRGQQERKKKAGKSSGTGKSGNGQDVGRTESMENSGYCGCGEQKNVREQPGRAESERTGKTVADTNTERKLQPSRNQQDIRNGSGIGCEDVQYTYSTGRKEQYPCKEPDKKGLVGWGCDAGDVGNASGEGLLDRAIRPVGGQKEEPQFERSMRRDAESILGRVADGISSWMDGDLDFIINHYWDSEPDIPRIASGIEHRTDRIKCLGNAVVPQQFYPVFRAIAKIETEKEQV